MLLPSFSASKITFNDLIAILNLPREPLSRECVQIFRSLNPYRCEQNFLVYHFLLDQSMVAFVKQSVQDFLQKWQCARDCSSRVGLVEAAAIEYVEHVHRQKRYLEVLNRVLYYLAPVHRVLSLSSVLLNFRSRVVSGANALRKAPSDNRAGWETAPDGSLTELRSAFAKDQLGTQDFATFRRLAQGHCFRAAFDAVRFEKLDAYARQQILVSRVLWELASYKYSRHKPFEGIKSLAVLELLEKESSVSFPGMASVEAVFLQMHSRLGFVKTDQLLIRLMNDDRVYAHMCDKVRRPIKGLRADSDFFDENLNELLQRVGAEAEQYIDWDEFKQYFTFRGGLTRLPAHVSAFCRRIRRRPGGLRGPKLRASFRRALKKQQESKTFKQRVRAERKSKLLYYLRQRTRPSGKTFQPQ